MSKDYVRPAEMVKYCTTEELENINTNEFMSAILNKILKRLDALENPPKK
tara:strand:+ start:580 stop:729 length:150 start_codon:yes stop_codon:yes gene_type:complete